MRSLVTAIVFLLASSWSVQASASWVLIKRYLQAEVVVVSETPERIVLRAPRLTRDIVVSKEEALGVDLYTTIVRRRRSNPFRVWTATRRLCTDEALPPKTWGQVFKTPFLRIIRRPRYR